MFPSLAYQSSSSLHPGQHLLISALLTVVVLMGVKWHFMVALIFISLMLSDVEHLLMCFLAKTRLSFIRSLIRIVLDLYVDLRIIVMFTDLNPV